MAKERKIGSVIKKRNLLYVYDEEGRGLTVRMVGEDAVLLGYTSTTFTFQQKRTVYTYDANNRLVSAKGSRG